MIENANELDDTEAIHSCVNCGYQLKSQSRKYCQQIKEKQCLTCKNDFEMKCNREYSTRRYCGSFCATQDPNRSELTRATNIERYGVPNVFMTPESKQKALKASHSDAAKIKRIETSRKNYGTDNPMQSPEIKSKVMAKQRELNNGKLGFNNSKQRETMLAKYGEITPAKNEEVKAKIRSTQLSNNDGVFAFNTDKQKQTMIERFGGAGRLSDPSEVIRQRSRMQELYGVDTPCELPEFLDRSMKTIIANNGQLFGNGNRTSKLNLAFAEKIKSEFSVEVELEKYIDGSFFDLYIPDANLLIDLNPTITHNSTIPFACIRSNCSKNMDSCKTHFPKKRNYHFTRAEKARSHGYRLIQIYDWDDSDRILKFLHGKIARNFTRTSARKCPMIQISQKEANAFLNEFHIQGGSKAQTNCYGLKSPVTDELIAVATFSKSRFKSKAEWEFNRYAVRENWIVNGGAGRLFKKFVEDESPKSVISYIDYNHTTGETFLNSMGFNEIDPTGEALVWHNMISGQKVAQTSLLAIGADRLLKTSYGPKSVSGLDNEQIMLEEGFVKVYTAGNRVYLWTIG